MQKDRSLEPSFLGKPPVEETHNSQDLIRATINSKKATMEGTRACNF